MFTDLVKPQEEAEAKTYELLLAFSTNGCKRLRLARAFVSIF